MQIHDTLKAEFRNANLLGVLAVGILSGWGKLAQAVPPSAILDSSVGKPPYQALASASGGLEAALGWESLRRSFRGKPPTVILSEGPPPRSPLSPALGAANSAFFYVYADHNSRGNPFQPIGYMGDHRDVRIDDQNREDPADGLTCTKVSYGPYQSDGQGWAGVYWLDPKTNWGYKPGGYNLSGMRRLTFWARGAKGGEQIAVFKVGGVAGPHADTGMAAIGPVWLTKQWRQYTIDLQDINLSKVSGGFAWSTSQFDNIGPIAFYLDDIRYER